MNGRRHTSPVTLRITRMVILMYKEEMEDDGCGEEQRKDGEEGRMGKELEVSRDWNGKGMDEEKKNWDRRVFVGTRLRTG